MKKWVIFIAAALLLVLLVFSGFYIELRGYAGRPGSARADEKIFTIHPGDTFAEVVQHLHQEDLIHHPLKFRLFVRLKGKDTHVQAGEYLLATDMSPEQILTTIVTGKVRLYRFTIPEGSNLYQIADIIDRAQVASKEDFVAAATDAQLCRTMGIPASTFEGYLFPDTYLFAKDTAPSKIIAKMVKRFKAIIEPQWHQRAREIDFDIHQIVTLASIIEKETSVASERPLISAVFHNRLKKGMRLGADPTVIYGIKNFDGNLTRKDLKTPTPYNTYVFSGLPIGPIANPGRESIRAALYPANTNYLYFVSRKDTTHQFSTNLKDHNRAIRKYQLGR